MARITADFSVTSAQWNVLLKTARPLLKRAMQATVDALELPRRNFSVSLVFSSNDDVQVLNRDWRGKDKPTNVLSFPLLDDFANFPPMDPIELGDIIMAYDVMADEAAVQKKSLRDHTVHLLVHGLLHLFGHDHMNARDAREMETLEIDILSSLGINNPYL